MERQIRFKWLDKIDWNSIAGCSIGGGSLTAGGLSAKVFGLTHDGVLVAARIIDKLVAVEMFLVLDGQAELVVRVAGRPAFEFDGVGVQLVAAGANAPQPRVALGAYSRPVSVGLPCSGEIQYKRRLNHLKPKAIGRVLNVSTRKVFSWCHSLISSTWKRWPFW